jgi:hypothetical protein
MHDAKPGPSADRTHPSMRGATIEVLAVPPAQDRPFVTLPDREIDGAGRPRYEGDIRRLLPLAHDLQRPVPALDGEVLDVRAARFGHPHAVETEQDSQRSDHRCARTGSSRTSWTAADGSSRAPSPLFHRHPIELDVGSGGRRRCHAMVAGQLEAPRRSCR